MASVATVVVRKIQCPRLEVEAELIEERVYCDASVVDVGRPFRVRTRKCSFGLDCNLAEYACRWSYINPNHDPFVDD